MSPLNQIWRRFRRTRGGINIQGYTVVGSRKLENHKISYVGANKSVSIPSGGEVGLVGIGDNIPVRGKARVTDFHAKITMLRVIHKVPRGRATAQLNIRSEEHTSELQSLRHLVC